MSHQFCRNGHDTFIVGRKASGHCRRCHALRVNRYRKTNRGAVRGRIRSWKRNGIICTPEQFRVLLVRQNRRCAVCKRHESEFNRAFDVDHDHLTGAVRGLVCNACNRLVIKVVECYSHLVPAVQTYLSAADKILPR